MNKSNLILASTLAIIFTSILIIFSPTSQKLSLSSPTPSPISTESISPTPDPTADWKTYENKEYGFSLEIPNYLVTRSRPNFPWQIDFWNESDDTTGYYKYYLNPLGDPQNYKTPLFWIFIDGNSIKELQSYSETSPPELTYIKPIDNNFSLFYHGVVLHDQVCATEKNGKTIMIECSEKNLSDPLFNQILSTFKFTDKASKEVPNNISAIFTAIKPNLVTYSEPTFQTNFISSAVNNTIVKDNWQLNVKSYEPKLTAIGQLLSNQFNMKNTFDGGMGGGGRETYENDKTICNLEWGQNTKGNPETWTDADAYAYLSCAEK